MNQEAVRRIWTLLALLALLLVLALGTTGCFKVRFLGDRTSKSFDKVFALQARASARTKRWTLKPMEAEMAKVSADAMVTKPKKAQSALREILLR